MKDVLYGPQTKVSISNFPFDYPLIHPEFIHVMVMIKKAAAQANVIAGKITRKQGRDIQKAYDTILAGQHSDQFVVSALHGGAGTSINVNVNEVIGTLIYNNFYFNL